MTGLIGRYQAPDVEWRGGERLCVVTRSGPKHLRLVDLGSLDVYRVPAGEARRLAPADDISLRRLLARLKKRRRAAWLDDFRRARAREAIRVLERCMS